MFNNALLALEASDGIVVVTSLVLVFGMLIALCLIIMLEGKIFESLDGKNKPAPKDTPKATCAPAPKAAAPAPKAPAPKPASPVRSWLPLRRPWPRWTAAGPSRGSGAPSAAPAAPAAVSGAMPVSPRTPIPLDIKEAEPWVQS